MAKEDTSGLPVPPPMIFLASLMIGLGLDYLWPLPLLPQGLQYVLGGALVLASLAFFAWALSGFLRAGTPMDPYKPTTGIIEAGPFAYSRNPVYLAMAVLLLGLAIAIDGLWVLIVAVPALAVVQRVVIRREEAYLEGKFGDDYRRYKARVRRWI